MKKLLAVLLAMALLLPMTMGLQADAAETEIKPFYLVNWSLIGDEDVENYSNVYPMAYLWADSSQMKDGIVKIGCKFGGSTPEAIAKSIKARFDTYPEGARYINVSPLQTALRTQGEVCFLEKGVPLMRDWFEEFLSCYQAIGGKLDGFTVDIEYLNIWSNYIQSEFADKGGYNGQNVYKWIEEHPVYQNNIRPKLVERGFKFYEKITPNTPELYALDSKSGSAYSQSRTIWNAVMRNYVGDIIEESCAPLWKYYPDALLSDYQTKDADPWHKDWERSSAGGIWDKAGNMSNEVFYAFRPGTKFYTDIEKYTEKYSTIPGYSRALYELTAFHRFMADANVAKTTTQSTDNGNVSWWISGHNYGNDGEGTLRKSPYYAENLIHMGMQNPKIYLGYILQQDAIDEDYQHWVLSLHIVDDVLKELTRVVGGADREPIHVAPTWNEHYVLSGMHVGGKNVWRLTPDTTKISLENFKVEGTDPTFSVNGQTITFPGGKIIETGNVREIGTCGYWIETAENVYPVATRCENYFREYPTYGEGFENYETGMEFTFNNAKPEACWEPKKEGSGSATIVADGNGKALAMKGGYTVKFTKLAQNVISGDTYAETQAWEITAKLPADLAADAELVLLNYLDAKNKAKNDGGFKVVGGKVYYIQEKEYMEMPGVALTNGNTYTFVREMNFSDEANFTSTYTVYDAAGNVIGQAKDIPVLEFVLPVASVSFSCKNVSGEALLVDNFKLYPTRVATDFYLYDATTGMEVTDQTVARSGDTAYRLSWQNATNQEKSYTVMAAYYNGDTLVEEKAVQEIKMTPNSDSIITGIVENKAEGQTLLVYLKDNNPAEDAENAPEEDNKTEAPEEEKNNNLILIIVAASAAVVVIAVIIVIVASAKKKKQTAASKTEQSENNEE